MRRMGLTVESSPGEGWGWGCGLPGGKLAESMGFRDISLMPADLAASQADLRGLKFAGRGMGRGCGA